MSAHAFKVGDPVEVIRHPTHEVIHENLIGRTGFVEQLVGDDLAIVRYGVLHYQWWRLATCQLKATTHDKLPIFFGVDNGQSAERFAGLVMDTPTVQDAMNEMVWKAAKALGIGPEDLYVASACIPTDHNPVIKKDIST